MKHEFKDIQGFRVIGLKESYEPGKTQGIGLLWEKFMALSGSIEGRVGIETYGICQCKGDQFDYVAGIGVDKSADIPKGMTEIFVEDGHYVVFTHRGPLSKIEETMKYIWSTWFPASDYEFTGSPDFELYDERFNFMSHDSEFDICIPVRNKVSVKA